MPFRSDFLIRNFTGLSLQSRIWLAVFALTALGTLLRLYGLSHESLWADELASWHQSHKDSVFDVIQTMRGNVHPPGWTVFLHYVQAIIGDSEAALRLPSAIAGIAAIPAIFVLGRYLHSTWTGLFAASLITVLWAPIYYSQEARAYSLLILLSILTTYILLRILADLERDRTNRALFVTYILLCTAASYLHYSGLVLVVFQGCWALMRVRRMRSAVLTIIAIYILLVLLYLPWLVELFNDVNRDSFWIRTPDGPADVLNYFFFRQFNLIHFPFIILLSVLVLSEVRHLLRERKDVFQSPLLFLTGWLIAPYGAFLLKSIVGTPILNARYLLVSAPAAYLILAFGLSRFIKRPGARWIAMGMLIGLSLFTLIYKTNYYTELDKTPYRQVVEAVVNAEDAQLSESLVLSYPLSHAYNYYFEHYDAEKRVDFRIPKPEGGETSRDNVIKRMDAFILSRDTRYIWLLAGHYPLPDYILKVLKQHGRLIRREDYGNLNRKSSFLKTHAWLFDRQKK